MFEIRHEVLVLNNEYVDLSEVSPEMVQRLQFGQK